MAQVRLGNFLKDDASTVWYNMIHNILEVLKACRLYSSNQLLDPKSRLKINLHTPVNWHGTQKKQWGLWMIFLYIPKNNEDSWFRIPKGFSITTSSNIDWQHICMNILSGQPPEVPNHIVWNSHFCVYSILLAKNSSRFSASQKRMGTWLFTIATLFGKDFLIIPLRLWNPVWVNMVKLSWFCRQKPVAHSTYAKKGTFVMSLWEVCFEEIRTR